MFQVTVVETDGVLVKFLKQTGKGYVWPDIEDVAFVNNSEIEQILPVPLMDGRGSFYFS